MALRGAVIKLKSGKVTQAILELAVKTRMAPNNNSTPNSGISHHFSPVWRTEEILLEVTI